ncbi:MAG: protein-export chaperone SecB [Holosporales bacterium]|jgi:preprotein translocase subunit SecB|nr:protein-export chaperone SecB [Holosporales bacterium]
MAENESQQNQGRQMQYPYYIQDQYVKDLTFENPNFLMKYSGTPMEPEVSVNVETTIGKLNEESYEVVLKAVVNARSGESALFVIEIAYAGLVAVAKDIPQEVLDPVLMVHCPFLMFPYLREMVSRLTQIGGYPPLMLEPIDFASIYLEKQKNREHPPQMNG